MCFRQQEWLFGTETVFSREKGIDSQKKIERICFPKTGCVIEKENVSSGLRACPRERGCSFWGERNILSRENASPRENMLS